MTRTFACSATIAALAFLWLPGCGGGGGGSSEAPKTPPPAANAPAPAATPTTLAADGEDENAPLLAWADVDTDEGKAPLEVQFKADVEGGKPPLKIVWKFGDGSPDSTDSSPKHTYDKPGKYRADLAVSDSSGDSDSDYVEIEVQ
jgi:PKD repeat protein